MADQPNVFEQQQPATPEQQDMPVVEGGQPPAAEPDVVQVYLQSILNDEGRPKYDSLEKALEALKHSQEYIPQLKQTLQQKETELAEAAEKLKQQQSLEETIQRLKQMSDQEQQPAPTPVTPVEGQVLSEDRIAELFNQLLEQRQLVSTQQTNEAKVNKALNDKFGDKASEVVAQRASELGMTVEQLKQLSQASPDAVLAWFNVKPQTVTSAARTGFVSPPPVAPSDELPRPSKSLLSGATSKEQKEHLKAIRAQVERKYQLA